MSQIRKHSIKGITDVLASTDAASKSYVDNADKVISSSGLDYSQSVVNSSYSSSTFNNWILRTLSSAYPGVSSINYTTGVATDDYYVIAGIGGIRNIQKSTDGVIWELLDNISIDNNSNVKRIYYSGEYYFLHPKFVVSTDLIVWTLRTSGFLISNSTTNGAGYGGGIYLAFGYGSDGGFGSKGQVAASTDTIHWTYRTSIYASDSHYANSYAYHEGQNLHITGGPGLNGSGGEIVVSTDSVAWQSAFASGGTNFSTAYYDSENQLALAAGVNSGLYVSTDGFAWSARTAAGGLGSGKSIQSIVWDNVKKLYYISTLQNSASAVSTDTIVWTASDTHGYLLSSNKNNSIIIYSNTQVQTSLSLTEDSPGRFLVSDYDTTQQTWESRRDDESSVRGYKEFYYNDSQFPVTITESFTIPTGSNNYYIELVGGGGGGATARNWVDLPSSGAGGGSSIYQSYKMSRSQFGTATTLSIRVGGGGLGGDLRGCSSSTDGLNWESVLDYDYFSSSVNAPYYDITYGNGLYVLVSQSGRVLVSTDSNTWQVRTSGTTNTISGIVYGDGIYALVDSQGAVTSTDTVVWFKRTTGVGAPQDIVYGDNKFIISGTGGNIAVSSDAIIWQQRTTPGTNTLYRVRYNEIDSKYFVTGSSKTIIDSTDTIVWTARTNGINFSSTTTDVNYVNGLYVITVSSRIAVSTDFISWTLRTAPNTSSNSTYENLGRGVVYFNNEYVLGGSYSVGAQYLVSTDTIVWESRRRQVGFENVIPNKTSINEIRVILDRIFVLANSSGGQGNGLLTYCEWTDNGNIRRLESDGGDGASATSTGGGVGGATRADTFVNGISNTADFSDSDLTSFYDKVYQTGSYEISAAFAGRYSSGSDISSDESVSYYYGEEYVQKTLPSIVAPGTYWTESPRESFNSSYNITYGNYSYTSEGGNEWAKRTSGVVNNINSIASKTGEYVAAGTDVLQSTDNVHWTLRSSQGSYNSVDYSNDNVVFNHNQSGGDAPVWTLRTSGTTSINDITYVSNTYTTVGNSGTIRTSTNIIVWEARTSGTTDDLEVLAYGNNTYVVGGDGTLRTSTDTINWTVRTFGFPQLINTLTYGNNVYVSGTNQSNIITSTDTIVWTQATIPSAVQLSSSIYAKNIFVVVGTSGTILTSTNAVVWTARTSNSNTLSAITYGNNLFVAGGVFGIIITSTDAVVWNSENSGTQTEQIRDLTYANNAYIAAGFTIRVSTDTIVWTLRTAIPDNNSISGLVYGNNLFVAARSDGTITTSPDYTYGVVPEQHTAVGTVGKIDTSTDSVMWELRTSGVTEDLNEIEVASQYETTIEGGTQWTFRSAGYNVYQSAYGNGYYVTAASSLYKSTDAIHWSQEFNPGGVGGTIRGVVFNANGGPNGEGLFVASDFGGGFRTSTDTLSWSIRSGPDAQYALRMTYDSTLDFYVAVGNGGKVVASTDSIHWVYRTFVNTNTLSNISSANGMYLIEQGNAWSTDTIHWEIKNTTGLNGLGYDMIYDDSFGWGVVGAIGRIATSTDTIVWTRRTSGSTTTINSVVYNPDTSKYYAALESSKVSESTDFIVWEEQRVSTLIASYPDYDSILYGSVDRQLVVLGNDIATSPSYDRPGYFPQEPYVAVGDNGELLCSTDEVHWTSKSQQEIWDFKSTNYTNSKYNIGGGYGVAPANTVWTLRTFGTIQTLSNINYYDNQFIVGGGSGTLSVSTNAISWTARTTGTGSLFVDNLAFGNGYYLFDTNSNATQLWGSTDTITWGLRTSGIVNILFHDCIFANGLFFAAGNDGTYIFSTDTIVWEARTTGSTEDIYGINYVNNNYVFTGQGFTAGISTDSIHWTLRNPGSNGTHINYHNGLYILAQDSSNTLRTSTDFLSWTARTTGFDSNVFTDGYLSLNILNNEAVITGQIGQIGFSTDAISWDVGRDLQSISNMQDTTYVNGVYYVVGNSGYLATSAVEYNQSKFLTSTDNNTWSSRTTTIDSDYINGIASDGTTTVAVGGGYLEGSLWTLRTSGTTNFIGSVEYIDSLFYRAGSNGDISVSSDFIVWTARTSAFDTFITQISYQNSLYFTTGSFGKFASSTDGIIWTLRTVNELGTVLPTRALTYISSDNLYYLGGSGATSGQLGVWVSTDAVIWSARTVAIPLAGSSSISSFAYASDKTNKYTIGGDNRIIQTSTNSIVWTARTTGLFGSQTVYVIYANNQYVFGTSEGNISSSTDAITWVLRTSNNTIVSGGIEYANNTFVIGGNNGSLIVSTDAIVWIIRTSGFGTNTIRDINYIRQFDYFIAAGAGGTIATSPVSETKGSISQSTDTVHWTARTSGLDTIIDLNIVRYENGIYLAGGDNGAIITSTDGTTWKVKSSTTSNNINDFVGGNNRLYQNSIITGGTKDYVVVGDVGTVLSGNGEDISRTVEYFWDNYAASTDGVYWTLRTNSGSISFLSRAALFNDGKFYTSVNDGSTLSVSTDTIVWTLRTIGISNLSANTEDTEWKRLKYDESDGSYYLGGSQQVYARVAYSSDALVWEARDPGIANSNLNAFGAFNGVVLAGSVSNGHIESSTDKGLTWSRRTTGLGTVTYYDFAYHKGLYVASTSSIGIVVSTDSISWTLRTLGFGGTPISLHSTGDYLLSNGNVGGKNYVFSSTDTITWEGYDSGQLGDDIKGFANSQDTLVLSGVNGLHATSQINAYTVVSDGSGINPDLTGSIGSGGLGGHVYGNRFDSWSIRTTYGTYDTDNSNGGRLMGFHVGKYVLSGTSKGFNAIQTSTDSVVWELASFDWMGESGNAQVYSGPVVSNDEYVIIKYHTSMWASTDNIVWQARTLGNLDSAIPNCGIWDGTYFIYQLGSRGLSVSTDTIHWTARTTGLSLNIIDNIVKGKDYYLFTGSGGTASASTDTIAWETRVLPGNFASATIQGTTYSDRDELYLLTKAGEIIVSTDTLSWVYRTASTTSNHYDMVYAEGLYFGGTGNSGRMTYSTDSIMWELKNAFLNDFSKDVGYAGDRFYNIGTNCLYMTNKIDYPSFTGNGFNGTRGGGGGGGSYDPITKKFGYGGDGGHGFARITWW